MRKSYLLLFPISFLAGCSAQDTLRKQPVAIREEFWPLDTTVARTDTVFRTPNLYRITIATRSLNDSAATYKATDDTGNLLIHAHQVVSQVTIYKDGQPLTQASFTKALFRGRDSELVLASTSFVAQQDEEFLFNIEACVPDSDICEKAQVAVNSTGRIKVRL
ncbi:DUF4738 domain-containing protein [Hymenobacter cellulosivorans]|uniref:DUF4738 domain-containing protein n=1 Tax=Hymenobacter cellulosivorans TaxID=2932249 RepID=A0ABY4F3P0_9BACT|nr:DUF4738 domain-containing protein [Hymenobacter cellulosivorans]UOQ51277.1 DUF4738 domain-containing protein [Hymenobacter cellulosivorans]